MALQSAICHPERSEGSAKIRVILHFVQDDNFAF